MISAKSPLVSVILPSFNCAPYLGEALESVLRQRYAPLEVIVVDDGSTDDTDSVLARYAGKIRTLRTGRSGPGGARNAGIEASKGEFIAFLDADDIWLPGKLESQVSAMVGHPEVGLSFTETELFNESGVLLTVLLPEASTGIRRRCLAKQGEGDVLVGYIFSDLLVGNAIQTLSVIVRRQCIDMVGHFNELLPAGSEDYDLWFRIAQRWPVALVDRVLARYRLRAGSASGSGRTGWQWTWQEEWQERCRRLRSDQARVRTRHLASIPPNLPRIVRQQLADHLLNRGWLQLRAGECDEARAWFRKCIRYGRGRPAALAAMYWVDSYLPAGVRQTLRGVRRSLRRGRTLQA